MTAPPQDPKGAWNDILQLGFRPRTTNEPGEAGGERTTYYCLGSFAFRLAVILDPSPGEPPSRIIVRHAVWDHDGRNVFMSDELNHHDLPVMRRAMPALLRLASIGRAPSSDRVLREIITP